MTTPSPHRGPADSARGRSPRFYVAATAIVLVSLLQLYALFRWGHGSGLEKFGALAALLGFYGIGLGFFCSSEQLAGFREIAEGLTDPNPLIYVSSNLYFCSILTSFGTLGLQSRMQDGAPRGLWMIGLFAALPVALGLMIYVLFHALIVTFLAYVPLVIAAALVVRMQYAAGDVAIGFGERRVLLKDVVRSNAVALRGDLMGVPSLALSVLSTVASVVA